MAALVVVEPVCLLQVHQYLMLAAEVVALTNLLVEEEQEAMAAVVQVLHMEQAMAVMDWITLVVEVVELVAGIILTPAQEAQAVPVLLSCVTPILLQSQIPAVVLHYQQQPMGLLA